MSDLSKLRAGYDLLKTGTLWKSTGKCRGFAVANPAEAAAIDAYVNALCAGQQPAPPSLSTATGQGLVEIINGGYGSAAPPPPPPPTVTITGQPVQGATMTTVVS